MAKLVTSRKMAASSSGFKSIEISNVEFASDGVPLGRGADAVVYPVEWNGTQCAAKRLHEILLEDDSPGGANKLIRNFEGECLTWSTLRHPAVVQFLGVYLDPRSRLPVLVMEKMDTSLRKYLEGQSKENFPLNLKAFVLRQVSQALAYLHGQNPPLVHHDLTTNNVLLNEISFVAKVTDFGMSRAVNPSILSRKSSIKGTLAFMAPEALQDPPRYNERLDIFSFGNVILSTLTHEWPEPIYHMKQQGEENVALTEFQRREPHTRLLAPIEKDHFLLLIGLCLEQRHDQRPPTMYLLQEMKHIESKLPRIDSLAVRFQRALRERDEAISQRDVAILECNEAIRQRDVESSQRAAALEQLSVTVSNVSAERDDVMEQKDTIIQEKQDVIQSREIFIRNLEAEKTRLGNELQRKDDVIREKEEKIRQRNQAIRQKDDELKQKNDAIKQKDGIIMQLKDEIKIKDGEIWRLRHSSNLVDSLSMTAWGDWEVIEMDVIPGETAGDPVSPPIDLSLRPGCQPVSRDWTTLKQCQRTIQHRRDGGRYSVLAINIKSSQLSVAEGRRVHILGQDYRLTQTLGEEGMSFSDNLWGLAFNSEGDILVSDLDNNRVCRVSQQNTLLQTISYSKHEPFKHPSGVAVDTHGRIFICDSGNHRVSVHDESGKPLHTFGSSGGADWQFNCPTDVDCSPDNHLYITDTFNRRICIYRYSKRNAACKFVRCFHTKFEPTCIAYASGDHLVITAMQSDAVMVYTTKGNLVHELGGRGMFRAPTGVVVDTMGMVYISDSLNNRIQVF